MKVVNCPRCDSDEICTCQGVHDKQWLVACMVCGHWGTQESTKNAAIESWNNLK